MTLFAGTGRLLRLEVRRDRVRLTIWVAAIGVMVLYSASALNRLYPTQADRQLRAVLMSSPAAVIMSGPGYGLEHYTLGAMVSNELSLSLVIASAIMSIFLVIRQTRGDEEANRAELIRAAAVGRAAPLTAALLVAVLTNVVLGAVELASLLAAGLDAVNSVALVAGLVVTSLVFAAVAAVAAQVTVGARSANGLALAVLAVAFVLRAIGDTAKRHGNAVSWFSPIAWMQQLRAFVDLRWWPLLLSLAVIVPAVTAAYLLTVRRDLGAGYVTPRPGRARAAGSLAGPFALAFRLQRWTILSWALGLAFMAVGTGSLTATIQDNLANAPQLLRYLQTDVAHLTAGFLSRMAWFLAAGVTGFAVASALRLHGEEADGHAEPVLTAAVSRTRWYGQGLLLTGLATVALLGLTGVCLGLGVVASTRQWALFDDVVRAELGLLPAVALLVGIAALLVGVAPRLTALAWLPVTYAIVVGFFGALLQLPHWTSRLSPFGSVPLLPLEPWHWTGPIVLSVLTVALVVAGAAAFRRRDVLTG